MWRCLSRYYCVFLLHIFCTMKTTALILASTVVAASAFSPSPMKMAAVSEFYLKDRGLDWIFLRKNNFSKEI